MFKNPSYRAPIRSSLQGLLFLLVLAAAPGCSDRDEHSIPSSPSMDGAAAADKGRESQSTGGNPSEKNKLPGPGQWRKFRTHKFDESLTKAQREMMEKLEAVGYASGSVQGKSFQGVTVHQQKAACKGLNLYTSGHGQEAILMDMEGRFLHKWCCEFWDVWPDYPIPRQHEMTQFWRRAYLLENGDVLAIYEGLGLVKLDRNSKVIWANSCRAHHDLDIMPGGDIYVLTREARVVPRVAADTPILEDFISILSAEGEEKNRISLLECFENSEFSHLVQSKAEVLKAKGRQIFNPDIFHANTLEIITAEMAHKVPEFQEGCILTSMLNLDAIAVVDLVRKNAVWVHKGTFHRQHDPKVLDNGNVMLFDNNRRSGRSRVLELDPTDGSTEWMYQGTKESPFYSKTCGTAQRLRNGNTLVTESDNGRAFEVTRGKTIVWQFYNPHRAGASQEYVAALFEVLRLNPEFPVGWLKGVEKKGDD